MPQEIEVTLKLKIKVEEADDASYYLDATTNEATPSFIADFFDEFEDSYAASSLLTVNDKTREQVAEALQAELNT